MRSYTSFIKKEFMEGARTYKLFIMGAVFALLGMMGPLLARYTPDILAQAMPPEMMIFEIPEPTAFDSWTQFFGNVGQMGFLAMAIIFSGITANELNKGYLINVLTKGLRRSTVICCKFTYATVVWTAGYLLCLAINHAYTLYFWPGYEITNAFITFFGLWLYGVLLIALVILGGILFASIYGSLLLTGVVAVVLSVLNIIPDFGKYNPVSLTSDSMYLLIGERELPDFAPAFIVCAALILICWAWSVAVFNKKQV